jgi:hypothetical protein
MATELVAEQAPGALHLIAEQRESDGKEPDGAAVELETESFFQTPSSVMMPN